MHVIFGETEIFGELQLISSFWGVSFVSCRLEREKYFPGIHSRKQRNETVKLTTKLEFHVICHRDTQRFVLSTLDQDQQNMAHDRIKTPPTVVNRVLKIHPHGFVSCY